MQNNKMFTEDSKCARSYAMSLYNTLSPINNLPYPNKENIATSLAAHCLYPTVFQKHPINRLQMVFFEVVTNQLSSEER